MKHAKPCSVWLTREARKKLEQVKEYIKKHNIEIEEIVKIPQLKGLLNDSMTIRFCIEFTADHLSKEGEIK